MVLARYMAWRPFDITTLGAQAAGFLKGSDSREILHMAAPKSLAVQMHLAPQRMQAWPAAAMQESTAQSSRADGHLLTERATYYYYPLLSNSGSVFTATVRANTKLLALDLIGRLRDHEHRWSERPGKLV